MIVDVEPGCVMLDVFVMVNVNVLVWELNSQTTVAVEACPVEVPTIEIVSALTVVLAALSINRAAIDRNSL